MKMLQVINSVSNRQTNLNVEISSEVASGPLETEISLQEKQNQSARSCYGVVNIDQMFVLGKPETMDFLFRPESTCKILFRPIKIQGVEGGAVLTSSSSGERRSMTAGQTSQQSRGEKVPGGPADRSEAVEWLREAWGDATASSSCGEATAGMGQDSVDPVDPRLPDKRGSRRA